MGPQGEGPVTQDYLFPIFRPGDHSLSCSQPFPLLLASLEPQEPQMGNLWRSSSPTSNFPEKEAGQRGKGTCPRVKAAGHGRSAPAYLLPASLQHPSFVFSHSCLLLLPHHWAALLPPFLSLSCFLPCPGLPVASPLPSFTLPLLPGLSSPGPWSYRRLPTLWPMFSALSWSLPGLIPG